MNFLIVRLIEIKEQMNKMKKIFPPIFLFLFFLILGMSFNVGAVVVKESSEISNPLETTSFTDLLSKIIAWIRNIGLLIGVAMVIYSGFLFMSAGGEEDKITTAKKALLWTLIGIAILLMGEGFITLIKNIITVD